MHAAIKVEWLFCLPFLVLAKLHLLIWLPTRQIAITEASRLSRSADYTGSDDPQISVLMATNG
jgi:hypothetical protein